MTQVTQHPVVSNHRREVVRLSTGDVYLTDLYKFLNEGDFCADIAQMIAKHAIGLTTTEVLARLVLDQLEIELDAYKDEVEAGRREPL